MVVGAVHGRPHEVDGTCVDAHVLLVDVLVVDGPRDEAAVGSKHKAAHLGEDANVAHASRHEHLLIGLAHALADDADVVGRLTRQVGHAHAAGQVHEVHMGARLGPKPHRKLEEDAGELGVVLVGHGVARQEGVDAEVPGAALAQLAEGLEELLGGHAVLGVAGVVHDAVGELEEPARVEAAAHRFGDTAHGLLVEVDVGDVVEVDDGAELVGEHEVLGRGIVAREHDVVTGDTAGVGKHELAGARAVAAAALLVQDLEDEGVGRGLDGEVLVKAGVPGEGLADGAGVGTDASLVVEVEGRGELLRKGFEGGLRGEGHLEVVARVGELLDALDGTDVARGRGLRGFAHGAVRGFGRGFVLGISHRVGRV